MLINLPSYRAIAAEPPAQAYDPYSSKVSLLLRGDKEPFVDERSHPLTAFGAVSLDTVNKKFGTASIKYPNSHGNYLSIQNGPDFNLGTSDFTLETWISLSGTGVGGGSILGAWSNTIDWVFFVDPSFQFGFQANSGNLLLTSGASKIPLNTWAHVAITRNGNVFRLFLDGALVGSLTSSAAIQYNPGTPLWTNQWLAANSHIYANFDELRLTLGVARYIAAFNPAAFTTPDTSTMQDRLTAAGAVTIGNGVTISTADSKTGKEVYDMNGTSDSYIRVGTPFPSVFDLSAENFTIEAWLKPRNTNVAVLCGNLNNSGGTGAYWITLNNTYQGFATVAVGNPGSTPKFGSTPLPVNEWSHVAISCVNNTIRCFINGVQIGSAVAKPALSSNKTIQYTIGQSQDGQFAFNGLIDDLRINNSAGKYTANFTPSVS